MSEQISGHAQAADAGDTDGAATGHALTPLRVYFGVFGALLALTGVTVGISYADLGPGALYLALFVALIKAGFVVGYFMHLKQDARFHQLVFFASGAFLIFMFAFTFIDLVSRSAIVAEQGSLVLAEERQQVELELELRQRIAAAKAAVAAGGKASLTPSADRVAASRDGGPAAEPSAGDARMRPASDAARDASGVGTDGGRPR